MKTPMFRIVAIFATVGLLLMPRGATHAAPTAKGLTLAQRYLLARFVEPAPAIGSAAIASAHPTFQPATGGLPTYYPSLDGNCPETFGFNVRVNQDCLSLTDDDLQGRAQTQFAPAIAADPLHPHHLVAAYQDYRPGDASCGASYSLDDGRTWHEGSVPARFTRGQPTFGADRQYWQRGEEPSVAWDSRGNAYLACNLAMLGSGVTSNPDSSRAIYVFRSTQNAGASWNFAGRPVVESADLSGSGTTPYEQAPFIAVDVNPSSPYRDRIYVFYNECNADGSCYDLLSYSSDYGEHFTAGQVVGGNSPLCVNQQGGGTPHGNCNANFPTPPVVGPDGALYLISGNINNANALTSPDSYGQILLSKSTDGGTTFSAPVLVGYQYDIPDCGTYQAGANTGGQCVPEKGTSTKSIFGVVNSVVGAVNPRNPQQIVVSIGSYINADSNERNGCVPTGLSPQGLPLYTGVKTPGACSNKIVLSVSTDGGATFTGATTNVRNLPVVNQDPRQATTDQFSQGMAFTRDGTLAVSYFDRQYAQDETTGFSDMTLSGSRDLVHFASRRATSYPMPPPTTGSAGGTAMPQGFNPLTAVETAHLVWPDTRNPRLVLCPNTGTATTPPSVCTITALNGAIANEQDIFTASLQVPTP